MSSLDFLLDPFIETIDPPKEDAHFVVGDFVMVKRQGLYDRKILIINEIKLDGFYLAKFDWTIDGKVVPTKILDTNPYQLSEISLVITGDDHGDEDEKFF